MQPEPQKEHRWLDRLVGRWTCETECRMGPDQPPMKSRATEVVRSLGGLWTVAEGEGEMPGVEGTSKMVMTLGFDPKKGRYLGTFVASIMTHLWVYDGTLDEAGRILTLDTEGPDFASEKMAKYRDIIEFLDDDRRVMTSEALDADGHWHQFMRADYQRVR